MCLASLDSPELRAHPVTWDCQDLLARKDYAVNPDLADEAELMALLDHLDRLAHQALAASPARMARTVGRVWLDHRDHPAPVPLLTQQLCILCCDGRKTKLLHLSTRLTTATRLKSLIS